MENILIDTDIVIEYLRSKDKSSTELIKLLQEHDVFLSSISEFELFLGVKTDRHQNDLEMLFSEEEYRFKKAALLWPFRRSRIEHLVFLPERANKTKNPNNPVNPVNPVCPACPVAPADGTGV